MGASVSEVSVVWLRRSEGGAEVPILCDVVPRRPAVVRGDV